MSMPPDLWTLFAPTSYRPTDYAVSVRRSEWQPGLVIPSTSVRGLDHRGGGLNSPLPAGLKERITVHLAEPLRGLVGYILSYA
jgi:hypothetical protein